MGHDRAARHLAPVRAALALCALTLAFLLPPTAAAEQPRFWTSCESKSGEGPVSAAGQCSIPRGIGVDPNIPGHLYVADQFNNRIVEITAWGEFVKAWGWGVRNGLAEPQACGPGAEPPSATCQKGLEGPGRGQLDLPQGVAVDSAGAVYVVDVPNGRLQKFDPAGEFAWMIGGEVNKTKIEEGKPEAEQNLCPIDPADVCQAGTAGTGQGQFGAWPFSSFVAIDTKSTATDEDDVLYVGDVDRIQEFDVGGAYQGEIALPEAGKVGSLAVDSRPEPTGGDLYFSYASSVNPTTGKAERPNVFRLSAAGAVEDTIEVPIPKALATDAEGYAYAYDEHAPGNKSAPGLHESRLLKFDPAGGLDEVVARKGQFEAGDFETTTGIATGSACLAEGADVYLSNSFHQDSFVRAWGPPPDDPECPPERRAPSIESQYAVSVGTVEAQIEAQVNPHYWSGSQGTTTYYTQYGTAACIEAEGWAGACVEEHPSPPGSTLGGGVVNEGVAAPVFLAGLEPGTAYRFRFAAESKDSEGVPTVEGQPVFGLEREFRTYQPPETPPPCPNDEFRTGPAADLPDCRAYELVSPVDKEGGEVAPPAAVRLDQSATSGNSLTYTAGPLPYAQLIASRGAEGWLSEDISPPTAGSAFAPLSETPFAIFSADLSEAWLRTDHEPVLAAGGVAGFDNLYRRDNLTDSYEACTTQAPPSAEASKYAPEVQGASADTSQRAIFAAPDKLTATAAAGSARQLYACEGGALSLASVLPSGFASPLRNTVGTANDDEDLRRSATLAGAVSSDASRLYWSASEAESGTGTLYLRINPAQPQSPQLHGSAQGKGSLIGPASGTGNTFASITTISAFKVKEGAFAVGQEVTGPCLKAGTKVTAVEVEGEKLKVDTKPTANCTGTEIVGLASTAVSTLSTTNGAFATGQTIVGTGIAPATTIAACLPSCGAGATSLTLSAKATQTKGGLGKGTLIGPALGEGTTSTASTTITQFKVKEAGFIAGQELEGECLAAETKVSSVNIAAEELKVNKNPTASCTKTEIVGLASNVITKVTVSNGAFLIGEAIYGPGIPPETTITDKTDTTLILSNLVAAGGTASNATIEAAVPLEAFSKCTEAAKACTLPVSPAAGARFWAASPDGSQALFGRSEGETESLHSFQAASGASAQIASGVLGVLGQSSDLSHVYFLSEAQIGGKGQVGKPNLYLYEAGGGGSTSFIATLSEADAAGGPGQLSPVNPRPSLHTARVTPDGENLAFASNSAALAQAVAGYDNTDQGSGEPDTEIYRYNATSEELLCVSCNRTGARPIGRAVGGQWVASLLPTWATSLYGGRPLSADGSRLFFEAYGPLALQDTNGKADVYQWELAGEGDCEEGKVPFSAQNGGCVTLISSGQAPEDSQFLDADPSGDNAFLATGESLLEADPGEADLYDARVLGGFKGEGPETFKVTVTVSGDGAVSADKGTISGCTSSGGPSCEGTYEAGTPLTLTATPAEGSELDAWEAPGCEGSSATTCEFEVFEDTAVEASFVPVIPKQPLSVNVEEGEGTVASSPAGILCGAECEAQYEEDSLVTLTASPAAGYAFKAWKNCDPLSETTGVNGRQCKVKMSAAKSVGAKFVKTYELSAAKAGGLGKLGTSPGGIVCLPNCTSSTAAFKEGATVTVTQAPSKHFTFTGWSGDCTGSGACTVSMSADKEVEALFTEDAKFSLSVDKEGGGQASIKSKGVGLLCGYTCYAAAADFYSGEVVAISWKLNKGTTSIEWSSGSGTCTGKSTSLEGSCTVTMSSAKSLVAKFE